MAASNFAACLDIVLVYEGGLSTNPADPGNWTGGAVGRGMLEGTKFGIAASAHPALDIPHLTRDRAALIYRADYWNAIDGDALPPGVDLAVFDACVNSGVGKAREWLAAARALSASSAAVVTAICDRRLSFLHALGNWRAFGKGWGARVAGIEAKALRMALGDPPIAADALTRRAAAHTATARAARWRAAAGVMVAPLAGGGVAAGHGHLGLVIALVTAGLLGAGILAFVAWRAGQRARALEAAASIEAIPLQSHAKP